MATKDISDAQVCRAYAEAKSIPGVFAETILMRVTGQPEKVCYRAMERAEARGLIEYGVSQVWLANRCWHAVIEGQRWLS